MLRDLPFFGKKKKLGLDPQGVEVVNPFGDGLSELPSASTEDVSLCSDSRDCALGWRCVNGRCVPPSNRPASCLFSDYDQGCGSCDIADADTGAGEGGGSSCTQPGTWVPDDGGCFGSTCGLGGILVDQQPDGTFGSPVDIEPEGGYPTDGRPSNAATWGGGPNSRSLYCWGDSIGPNIPYNPVIDIDFDFSQDAYPTFEFGDGLDPDLGGLGDLIDFLPPDGFPFPDLNWQPPDAIDADEIFWWPGWGFDVLGGSNSNGWADIGGSANGGWEAAAFGPSSEGGQPAYCCPVGGGAGGNPPSPGTPFPPGGGGNGGCDRWCDERGKATGETPEGCNGKECGECAYCDDGIGTIVGALKCETIDDPPCNCPGAEPCGKCKSCKDGTCKSQPNCEPPPEPPPPPGQPPGGGGGGKCFSTSVCQLSASDPIPKCPPNYKQVGSIKVGDGRCLICERCPEDCSTTGCPDCQECKTLPNRATPSCQLKEKCGGECPNPVTVVRFGPPIEGACDFNFFTPTVYVQPDSLRISCRPSGSGQVCEATGLSTEGCPVVGSSWFGSEETQICTGLGGGPQSVQLGIQSVQTVCQGTRCCKCSFNAEARRYKCSSGADCLED